MSSDTYYNQYLHEKMGYSEKVEEGGEEWQETNMNIYMNEDDFREDQTQEDGEWLGWTSNIL